MDLKLPLLPILLACLLACGGRAQAQPADAGGEWLEALTWYDGVWPHERSDIAPDPAIRFGRLDSGLRYAILPNAMPPGRASLQLLVQAGSLMEEDGERGYAHFVEHMAFNGSRRFGPGDLIPFFQSNGMSFGGDTNAHTNQRETVYRLSLAASDGGALAQGLRVLRDFADGLTMPPREVDAEKGVILAEKTARENESALAAREWRKVLFGDSALGMDPIGEESCILAATGESLLRFYRKWYRPDRMVLVAVGEVDPDRLEGMIRDEFGSMPRPQAPLPFPTVRRPPAGRNVCFVQRRPTDFAMASLAFLHPAAHAADSRAAELASAVDLVARLALQNRLSRRVTEEDSPWTKAAFAGDWRQGLAPMAVLSAFSSPEGWRRALEELHAEWISVREFGFDEWEVAAAADQVEKMLGREAAERARARNDALAEVLVGCFDADEVASSPQQSLERYAQIRGLVTREAASLAVRDAFAGDLSLRVSGGMEATEEEVRALWAELERRGAERREQAPSVTLPYLPLPPAPASLPATEKESLPMPSGTLASLAAEIPGGIRLRMVPLPEQDRGSVRVSLTFGRGLAFMDERLLDAAKLAELVLGYAGPGRLTPQDRAEQLDSRGVFLVEDWRDHAVVLSGASPSAEVPTLLLALWTQFVDPLPEGQAKLRYDRVREGLALSRASRFDTVDGVSRATRLAWCCGDSFLPMDADRAAKVSLEEVKAVVNAARAPGLREILVTGDFDPAAVLPQIVRLFGGLANPAVPMTLEDRSAKCVFPENARERIAVAREQVDKAVVRLAWRADLDVTDRRALAARALAVSVLRDRMRREIRERMGASYSPFGAYRTMEAYGGFGFAFLEAATTRGRADETASVMAALAGDLARNGVLEEEVERLRRPMLTAWRSRSEDGESIHAMILSGMLSGLPTLRWNAAYGGLLESLTAEDVSAGARALFGGAPAEMVVEGGPPKDGEAEAVPEAGGPDGPAPAEAGR